MQSNTQEEIHLIIENRMKEVAEQYWWKDSRKFTILRYKWMGFYNGYCEAKGWIPDAAFCARLGSEREWEPAELP